MEIVNYELLYIYWVKCLNDFGCLMFFVFWVGFEFEMWG